MYNKVVLIGNLTKDPQGRFLPSGTQTAEFSIAYNRRYKVGNDLREESHYFDVRAYGKLAERLLSDVSKGYTVLVEGRLTQDRWKDQDGKSRSKVYITAMNVRILRKPKTNAISEEEIYEDVEEISEDVNSKYKPFSEDDQIPF